ncbi:MAG: hypothetical protein ACLP6G_09355 [Terriglobales bacterium]
MMEPWLDPIRFGMWYGGLGGGLLGLSAAVLGAVTGALAPKGKGRDFILSAFTFMKWVGVVHLVIGIYAVYERQPYGIWYPLVLIGGLFSLLFSLLRPIVRKRYEEVEQQQMSAGTLRQA